MQLQAYERIHPLIHELGSSLLAISPQSPAKSAAGVAENSLTFPVLFDRSNETAREYRLVFPIAERLRRVFLEVAGIDLKAHNDDDAWELPIPGTFIIERRGIVRLAYVHADYTRRLEPSLIVRQLRQLKREENAPVEVPLEAPQETI